MPKISKAHGATHAGDPVRRAAEPGEPIGVVAPVTGPVEAAPATGVLEDADEGGEPEAESESDGESFDLFDDDRF